MNISGKLAHLTGRVRSLGSFFVYVWWRFEQDGCLRLAAGLSYASLLSLVPLLTIALAILAAFPAFHEARETLRIMVFELLPQSGDLVAQQFERFLANALALTAVGILGLAVTALLLLWNIHGAINAIWRVGDIQATTGRFLAYWTIITLGPMLLALSLSLSTFVLGALREAVPDSLGILRILLSRVVSLSIGVLGFAIFYKVVPQREVLMRHAVIGGIVAAVLIELLQYAFGLYLSNFPSYRALYGALAAIPIFLVFMYLSWSVVLLGAEVVAALPEFETAWGRHYRGDWPGERLALALSILQRLREASRVGELPGQASLMRGLGAKPEEVGETLVRLTRCGLVARSGGRLLLARDLGTVSLGEFLKLMGLSLNPGGGWQDNARRVVEALETAVAPLLERDLEALLHDPGAADVLKISRPRLGTG